MNWTTCSLRSHWTRCLTGATTCSIQLLNCYLSGHSFFNCVMKMPDSSWEHFNRQSLIKSKSIMSPIALQSYPERIRACRCLCAFPLLFLLTLLIFNCSGRFCFSWTPGWANIEIYSSMSDQVLVVRELNQVYFSQALSWLTWTLKMHTSAF